MPKNDDCPNESNLLALKNCPDNDGLADKDDACPTVAGVALFGGCPDSVQDAQDRCPEIAGKLQFEGCPDQKTLNTAIKEAEQKAKLATQNAAKANTRIIFGFFYYICNAVSKLNASFYSNTIL